MKDTALRDSRIVEMRRDGRLIREICEELNICKNTALKVLRENGVVVQRSPWYANSEGLSPEEFAVRVTDEYRNGATMQDIADGLGGKIESVRRVLKENGLSPSGVLLAQGISTRNERNEKIIECRMAGMTYDEIAETLSVSKSVVYRTCKESGVNDELREKGKAELEKKVMELYHAGMPAKRIKAELHKTYDEVRSILEKNGCAPSNRSHEIKTRDERIYELADNGSTAADIAAELGMNVFSVYHILERRKKSDADAENGLFDFDGY